MALYLWRVIEMLDLLELLTELRERIRSESYFDQSDKLWREYLSCVRRLHEMEMELLK